MNELAQLLTITRQLIAQQSTGWVTEPKLAEMTGYTTKALQRKRQAGTLIKGTHWIKDPDGRIQYNIEAYFSWLTSTEAYQLPVPGKSASGSTGKAKGYLNRSVCPPLPQI